MPIRNWLGRTRKSSRRLSAKHRVARRVLFSFAQLEDRRVLAAEADVFGNGSPITDNTTTTNATNHTNFGSVTVPGTTNVIRTFTITNNGDTDLTISAFTVGSAGLGTFGAGDFSIVAAPLGTVTAGQSTTFQIKFDPSSALPSTRQAKVSFNTNDSSEAAYDFRIAGTALDPPDVFVTNNDSNPFTWIEIPDADTTPNLADGTDYGGIPVGATLVHNFRVGNASLTNSLGFVSPKVSVSGTDFTIDPAAIAALPASIAILGSATVPITFHPTTPGVKTATVSIFTNDADSEGTYTFDVTGISGAPEINITGNDANIVDGDDEASAADDTEFGGVQLVAQSAIHTFTIQNNGDDDLNLTGITFADATTLGGLITLPGKNDFSVDTTFGNTLLAPGATTTFKIKFDPNDTTGGGDRYAEVRIGSNDSNENPYNFYLHGKGLTPPDISVADGISDFAILATTIPDADTTPTTDDGTDFGGTRLLGGTVAHSFRILNSGDVPLTITSITITEDDPDPDFDNFTITLPTPTTVPAAASLLEPGEATFEVTFDPRVEGLHTATVNISSNDPTESESLYTFTIQGIGGFPDLRVTTGDDEITDNDETSLPGDPTDFGAADLSGQTFTKTFTLTNNGDRTLELGAVTIIPATILGFDLPGDADFTNVTPPSDNSLAPGESTTLVVKYDPSPLPKGGLNTSPLNPDVNSPDFKSGLTATDIFRAATIKIVSNDTGKNPFNFAVSGQALVGTVRVTKSGSTVTIDDIAPGGHANGFVVSILGSDLIVSDALSVETITTDSEARTGGVLSAFNKLLTIPAAGIRTVTINANGGNDTFQLGLLTGLTTVNMNGGDGDDSFGSSLLGIIPQPLTTVKINGGANTAAGDKVFTDISILPSLPVITLGTQANNATTTLFAVPLIGYTYTGVEVASLRDNNTATEFEHGDFYARGGNGADKFDIKSRSVANQATFTTSGIPTSLTPYLIPGKVIFAGRAGNDSFTTSYTGHAVYFYGEEGNDSLKGGAAGDKIVGGPGNDTIDGGEGNNLIWGDNDPIIVGLADTAENREALSDNVPGVIPAGLSAAPHPTNSTYIDAIKSGNGNDEIYAGPGNDGTSSTRLNAGGGDDVVFGGDGIDFIELGAGNDRGYGGAGNDNINGGNGHDLLAGNDGVDTLRGGAGNDVLIGGAGADSINGDTNTDRVYQGNVTVTVNTSKLLVLPPVAAAPYSGTDKSRRKGDIHDQAMAELIADWSLDGALGANLTVVTNDVFTTG